MTLIGSEVFIQETKFTILCFKTRPKWPQNHDGSTFNFIEFLCISSRSRSDFADLQLFTFHSTKLVVLKNYHFIMSYQENFFIPNLSKTYKGVEVLKNINKLKLVKRHIPVFQS